MHWLDTTEYPFAARYFKLNAHHLHYVDEGQGEPILFVHGTPSWSYDFRNVINELRTEFRCMAIDHLGFGLSDKPEAYDYSPQQHSLNLEQFVVHHNLTKLTLVLHDFGGPIGMQMALRQSARIKRIIILNSWIGSSSADPDFIKLSKILRNPIIPWLYRNFNFSARVVMPQSFGAVKLSTKHRKQFTQPFLKRNERDGPLAFLHSLLHDQPWFEELWRQREALQSKPLLLIWGMRDPVVKVTNLKKFVSGFPHAEVVAIEMAGHFPQEEQPHAVATAIRNFMTR